MIFLNFPGTEISGALLLCNKPSGVALNRLASKFKFNLSLQLVSVYFGIKIRMKQIILRYF